MQGTRSSSQTCRLSLVLEVVILMEHFFRTSIIYVRNKQASKNGIRAVNWIKPETLQNTHLGRHLGHVCFEPAIHVVRGLSPRHVKLTVVSPTYSRRTCTNMAANVGSSLKWQDDLPKHPVFRELSQIDDEASSSIIEECQERTTKNIFIENDGEIFLWNSWKSNLLTANLKNLHFENERSGEFQVS